jgi:outer membrane protein
MTFHEFLSNLIFTIISTTLFCINVLSQPANLNQIKSDWIMTVGAVPIYSPIFLGSKDYGFSIFPDLRLNYKDDFFASVPEGIGYNLINTDSIKFGPLTKIRFSREEQTGGSPFLISGESDSLQGLGNVGTAGEAGFFAQYKYQKFKSRFEIRQGFGGHQGLLIDGSINYSERFGPLNFSIGPKLSFGSSNFIDTYYGVDKEQSIRSGLNFYEANSGITTYGIGASINMPIDANFAVTFFTSFDRLGNQIANSSLIQSRGDENQFMTGLAFGYRFGL